MADAFIKTVNTDFDELVKLCAECHNFLLENSVSEEVQYKLDLGIEEMATNVVKYGYIPFSPENKVTVRIEITRDNAVLQIEDEGHEFDPVAFDEPDTSGTIAEREVGGVGIHLTRSMTDVMEYRRENNKNILTIKVNL